MFKKVLIANRGEIACRVARTLRALGVHSVAVYSRADQMSRHVLEADSAILIGDGPASESYLDAEKVLRVAVECGAEAIHPGYGFLSENADFAEKCAQRGIAFIGPRPAQLRDFGLKHQAKLLAKAACVPLLPGTELLGSVAEAKEAASRIGFPVMLKSTAGGGGIGMVLCETLDGLEESFESVRRLSQNNFKNSGVFLEKCVRTARHVEIQIFGDGKTVVALGDRDCSAQRRNQKVMEETPAPGLSDTVRQAMSDAALRLARSVAYESAGTVEFIFDNTSQEFYFLEVNTRLQVEHGVTEEVTGIDLVEWMVRHAAGEDLGLSRYRHHPLGHSMQVRIYAEDPARNFQPCPGLITEAVFGPGARVDTWVEAGVEVSPYYDPMIAKVIVHANTRVAALEKLNLALIGTKIGGIQTNIAYLIGLLGDRRTQAGELTTRTLGEFLHQETGIEVLRPGTQTTVQDVPGRVGYWSVGIPPSGPMDPLSFRLANRVLDNPEGAAGLEMTMEGAGLRFRSPTLVALTGADMQATLDGKPIPRYVPISVCAGQTLEIGRVSGPGVRGYLAVFGGIQTPQYLGSRSTFTLGAFGGHGGRALRVGDVLPLAKLDGDKLGKPQALNDDLKPRLGHTWTLDVLYGPHGAPDFFTEEDIQALFAAEYEVHYNSARTGVRLIGPKPKWAREDGGEAGLHPSNIHDNAYAVGAIDFTGDMPILLGPDGPSLGGFVCPATIVHSDIWKLGQLAPGDKIRFKRVSEAAALLSRKAQDEAVLAGQAGPSSTHQSEESEPAVLFQKQGEFSNLSMVVRRSGDGALLVEFGPNVLDLNLRFVAHAFMVELGRRKLHGVLECTPGIRSLQVQFDATKISSAELLSALGDIEASLEKQKDICVPSRIVHLPLSWDDPQTQLAARKYQQLVRKDAPWCPDNIEFIRRINGLDSVDAVRDIVFGASYMVMGLGDVYLGAPVATPVDPRHRLVTTKYNPARTWTPENAVGIGGAYLCIYGMEGPGGYQFVGRTLQVYSRFRVTKDFVADKPWLLRFFDQLRFYPVEAEELLQMRADFAAGRHELKVEASEFSLADYNRFLGVEAESIATFKNKQQSAFLAERQRWIESGQINFEVENPQNEAASTEKIPEGAEVLLSQVPGSVWKIEKVAGDQIAKGEVLLVLESMKMEISIQAPAEGRVLSLNCREGQTVAAGDPLLVFSRGPQ